MVSASILLIWKMVDHQRLMTGEKIHAGDGCNLKGRAVDALNFVLWMARTFSKVAGIN